MIASNHGWIKAFRLSHISEKINNLQYELYESAMVQLSLLVPAEKSKMAARSKCEGLWYIICCTDLMHFNTSNK